MEANEMGSLPIGRLLRKMSMPLIISMFVQVLYGLVDSLYVARLGDNALTAISLCMPVQYLVFGIGTGIGVGVNSVLSKKLGEKDQDGVNRTAGNGFVLLWAVMILFIILGATAMTPFYQMQTDITEILEMCISYSVVLCIFSFAALHQIMMERLLSSIGRSDLTMIPMLIGAVTNIILDPIMIFGWLGFPAMGITGAGIATVTAQAVAAVVGFFLNLKYNRDVHVSAGAFRPNGGILGEIVKIGIPVALAQCLISLVAFGMNNILLGLSALAPGIYVIYIRLQSFVIMPSGGMSNAGISIIAYNYGAKEKKRVMDTLWTSLRVNLIVAVIGLLVFLAFPQQLLSIFDVSEATMAIGVPALRIIAVALVLTTTTQILSGFLQALGQGTSSFVVAITQAIFLLSSAWLLSLTGNVVLVWLAFPIMEVLRFVIAAAFVRHTYKSKLAELVQTAG
ncbi:MATE family efflux transporter [Dysosmobacter welbionis]|uniref:MATE family efflux transporter n=1 Tax=Dysosmobacter welbionis TaxID=2093857 RepID=UPI0032BF83BA